MVAQSVYPTGTTIYDPTQTWNGYTVLSPLRTQAVVVIDMNGKEDIWFIYRDLSVRTEGKFYLKFALMNVGW